MAVTTRLMDDPGIWAQGHFIAMQSQPGAQIHIFIVKKIALIKSPQCLEYAPWKQHKHAAYPIWKNNLVFYYIVAAAASTEKFAQYFEWGGEMSGAVFQRAVLSRNNGRYHTHSRELQASQQCWKGIVIQTNVRIDHAKNTPGRVRKCLIMISGKSLCPGIANDANRKRKAIRRKFQFLV